MSQVTVVELLLFWLWHQLAFLALGKDFQLRVLGTYSDPREKGSANGVKTRVMYVSGLFLSDFVAQDWKGNSHGGQ